MHCFFKIMAFFWIMFVVVFVVLDSWSLVVVSNPAVVIMFQLCLFVLKGSIPPLEQGPPVCVCVSVLVFVIFCCSCLSCSSCFDSSCFSFSSSC